MMTVEFLIAWLVMMVPLIFSPGPANIMFAATGARFGLRRSIPLLMGIDLTFLLYTLVIGFGAGKIFELYPQLLKIIQYFSAVYLLYLAYKYLYSHSTQNKQVKAQAPGFWHGVGLQLLNVKGISMLVLMFSVFSDTLKSTQYLLLIISLFFILNVIAHVFWISASSWIASRLTSEKYVQNQNRIFALMLGGVALWLVL